MTDADLVRRHAAPVPRYTSYPTAPHFGPEVDEATYRGWLAALPDGTALSLYAHIPFCDRLCWFCGCTTKQVLRYDPVAAYLPALHREIETVAALLDGRGRAAALHLGGGSPSLLRPGDLVGLARGVRRHFALADRFEFSVEIDPSDMTEDRHDGLAAAGVTRISIGVQDFDPRVQAAINRPQSFEQTRRVVEGVRSRGIGSVNLDVLYGLPHQTTAGVLATVEQALALSPDRIALFGYAHVPWMKAHQRMIDETALPDAAARYDQARAAATRLVDAGYAAIGIDHFARAGDGLAVAAGSGALHRNFQGYTTDAAPALIGFGASAIGSLPQGHVQNAPATGEYRRRVAETGLAVARGVAFAGDDRLRGYVIERLMCDFAISVPVLRRLFGAAAEAIVVEMVGVAGEDADGLLAFDGDVFAVTETGRPFVRSIAARFDAYLARNAARHSIAV